MPYDIYDTDIFFHPNEYQDVASDAQLVWMFYDIYGTDNFFHQNE